PVKEGVAAAVVQAASLGGLRIVETANVAFTRAGNGILFGIAPPIQDTLPADSLVGKAVFDLWNYKDPTLQPAQKLTAARDRNRSYEAVYYPATKKLVQLTDDSLTSVNVGDDAHAALGTSRERYMISSMWGEDGTDVY